MDVEGESTLLSDYLRRGTPCVLCGGHAHVVDERSIDSSVKLKWKLRDLTEIEFFAATEGMGLPEEQQCCLEDVAAALKSSRVVAVEGQEVPGSTRSVLHCIRLSNGYAIHLAAGSYGATVYRLVRPVSYTDNVLKEVEK